MAPGIALLASVLFAVTMYAQTTVVAGTVELYQPTTRQFQLVPAVMIRLTPPGGEPYVGFTDTEGRFSLEVPTGAHVVEMTYNTYQLREYLLFREGPLRPRRYILLPMYRYASYGYVYNLYTRAPIEGASVAGSRSDATGFYFVYFGDFSSAFGTTLWPVSAPGYQSYVSLTRRETLIGIIDYALKPERIEREIPKSPREL